ncbi:hypothetical protein N0V90_013316 [Kalmusia sp. IMI 367209]|nr:hypothetical protein N0V90_013316 [Kalmusia sp. IMI 367209]
MATIGILSIGQMGKGVASLLLAHNFVVITNVSDRSPATQERARSTSIECLSSDQELVARADYILSIVPPRDAVQTAMRVVDVLRRDPSLRASKQEPLYYLDLNAISPETARRTGTLFEQEKRDAAIHGHHLADVLNTQHLDARIGTASGLKCTFAALSKGFTALALQSFTTAASLGVLPQLQDYISQHSPGVNNRAEKGITGCSSKAYRWIEEMNQIGECFATEGGWPESANVFRNIAGVYEGLARVVEKRGGTEGMEGLSGALSALTEGLMEENERGKTEVE